MRSLPLSIVAVFIVAALAGCFEYDYRYDLRSRVSYEDGEAILKGLLQEPRFKDVADRVAPFVIRVDLHDADADTTQFNYSYRGGIVSRAGPANPDFVLSTSYDVALAILNADDGFRVFACAMRADAVVFEAASKLRAASFNGAKGRLTESATDCAPKVGDKVTFRGREGALLNVSQIQNASTGNLSLAKHLPPHVANMFAGEKGDVWDADLLVFNEWRAPTGWLAWRSTYYCLDIQDPELCKGARTSVPSTVLAECKEKVEAAYAEDPPEGGWDAGLAAARATNKAGEEALCELFFGGA